MLISLGWVFDGYCFILVKVDLKLFCMKLGGVFFEIWSSYIENFMILFIYKEYGVFVL